MYALCHEDRRIRGARAGVGVGRLDRRVRPTVESCVVHPLAISALLAVAQPTPAEHIDRGMRALEMLDYDVAAFELSVAATDPSADDAQRIQAHLYAGIAQRVLGNDTEARLHFIYVLRHAPSTELPAAQPPKIQMFWELVRSELSLDAHRDAASPSTARSRPRDRPTEDAADPSAAEAGESPSTAWLGPVLGISAGALGVGALVFASVGAGFGLASQEKTDVAARAQFQDDAVDALTGARDDAITADLWYAGALAAGAGAGALAIWAALE